MKKEWIIILGVIFQGWFGFSAFAQTPTQSNSLTKTDSIEKRGIFNGIVNYFEEAKKDKSYEKFDISFIGGPNYSKDTKLGVGILASGLYRLDKTDSLLPPSDVSVFTNISTSGFFSVGLENHTFFPKDRYRIFVLLKYSFMPTRFYGIGYEAGKDGIFTTYDQNETQLEIDLLKKIFKHTYAGLNLRLKNAQARNFETAELMPEGDLNHLVFGGGITVTYDSRDFIPNPSNGWYFKYEENFYPTGLGHSHHFREARATIRTYRQVSPSSILAFDFNAHIKTGDVPWNMLSLMGGPQQMRGYLLGRYRDKKQLNTQVELRQKLYNRHGMVVWAGMGKVFESIHKFQPQHILPNYGVGYRWEFKNKVNIRIDYGMGKNVSGFYFNINEAF